MKIAYVVGVFPKLSETFILNEMTELIRNGHEIYIFSLSHSSEKFFHKEIEEYNLVSRAYYVDNYIFEVIKSIKTLFKFHSIKEKMLVKYYLMPKAIYFSKIAKELNIDVLHAHFANSPTLTAMMISKLTGIPYTFTAHANDIFVNPNALGLKEKMENASVVITPSYYNQEYLHNLTGVDKEKIHVIRACANIDRLKDLKRKEKYFTILTVARLVEKKGIMYGIQAIKELIHQFPEVQYRIVGSGPLEKELRILVRSLDLEKNVLFLGSLDDSSLINELTMATLFILPCVKDKKGDMDGIPVSLITLSN